MSDIDKICDIILATKSNFNDAQNVGIIIDEKFGNDGIDLIIKLREIAFYVQSLSRQITC